ncbi:hypothetical protein [Tsuneonella dongtanensis]|uniref:hypothetical protein n=1 Tax=Tsuneonella dongtanensis TaxID=692370 RepID=UPI0018DC4EF9|nr:hypothetical protein [Tsuneonella dongtanensis]
MEFSELPEARRGQSGGAAYVGASTATWQKNPADGRVAEATRRNQALAYFRTSS